LYSHTHPVEEGQAHGVGALVLLGGLVFATQLPRRWHARPVYARLGILPETAAGVNAANELAPESRG
jgi:hypothetical protein